MCETTLWDEQILQESSTSTPSLLPPHEVEQVTQRILKAVIASRLQIHTDLASLSEEGSVLDQRARLRVGCDGKWISPIIALDPPKNTGASGFNFRTVLKPLFSQSASDWELLTALVAEPSEKGSELGFATSRETEQLCEDCVRVSASLTAWRRGSEGFFADVRHRQSPDRIPFRERRGEICLPRACIIWYGIGSSQFDGLKDSGPWAVQWNPLLNPTVMTERPMAYYMETTWELGLRVWTLPPWDSDFDGGASSKDATMRRRDIEGFRVANAGVHGLQASTARHPLLDCKEKSLVEAAWRSGNQAAWRSGNQQSWSLGKSEITGPREGRGFKPGQVAFKEGSSGYYQIYLVESHTVRQNLPFSRPHSPDQRFLPSPELFSILLRRASTSSTVLTTRIPGHSHPASARWSLSRRAPRACYGSRIWHGHLGLYVARGLMKRSVPCFGPPQPLGVTGALDRRGRTPPVPSLKQTAPRYDLQRLVGGVAGCPVFGLVEDAGGNKFPEPSTLEPPGGLDTGSLALESQP
ncbi:hypothetical protein DFH06DRAFT_1149896 [Mycena polygramma]|nr:hypothetical protein DFH06DRAFT_1149896 [Mycena polygramma]